MAFSFKRFHVEDSRSAMKVGTDAVLLGSWMEMAGRRRMLDVGCGSGIISLIAAQRADVGDFSVTAIDIEAGAVADALDNFAASPWREHLSAEQVSFQDFTKRGDKFDLIFSNPPYFSNSLKSPVTERTDARHNDSLPHTDLISCAALAMAQEAVFALILPADEAAEFALEATCRGLKLKRQCFFKTSSSKPAKRVLMEFTNSQKAAAATEELILDSGRYVDLVRDFYLKLKFRK